MAKLSPAQLINLAQTALGSHVKSHNWSDGTVTLYRYGPNGVANGEYTITVSEYDNRIIQAAAIMLAESGGDTDAFRPASKNPKGGNDRGLWQWNDKAWPQISDLVAYDPAMSTRQALIVSEGFSKWGPWARSNGLNHQHDTYKTIKAEYENMLGVVVDDTPILSDIDPDADGIPDAVEGLASWTDALGKLLGNLTSADWWRRVGVGVLGVAFVLLAVILIAKAS